MLVNVSEQTGTMSIHGEVNHSTFYNSDEQRSYFNNYNIRRSIFMGDFIYAISAQGVTVTNLTSMDQTMAIALDYQDVCYGCYDARLADEEAEGDADRPMETESSPDRA